MRVCVSVCVWFARSATAGMKYVGTTFIVGEISTGGRCTICKVYPGRTQIDRDVLHNHMSTSRPYDYGFYQVDWRMTSSWPLVKKAFSVFFRFTLEIPFQIRDSAIPRSRKLTGTTPGAPVCLLYSQIGKTLSHNG